MTANRAMKEKTDKTTTCTIRVGSWVNGVGVILSARLVAFADRMLLKKDSDNFESDIGVPLEAVFTYIIGDRKKRKEKRTPCHRIPASRHLNNT